MRKCLLFLPTSMGFGIILLLWWLSRNLFFVSSGWEELAGGEKGMPVLTRFPRAMVRFPTSFSTNQCPVTFPPAFVDCFQAYSPPGELVASKIKVRS